MPEPIKTTFRASIKELSTKTLVSSDLSTHLTLTMDNLPDQVKNLINAIQSSDLNKSGEVTVTLEI